MNIYDKYPQIEDCTWYPDESEFFVFTVIRYPSIITIGSVW